MQSFQHLGLYLFKVQTLNAVSNTLIIFTNVSSINMSLTA